MDRLINSRQREAVPTFSHTPLQEEEQTCAALTGHVVLNHEGHEGTQTGHGVELDLLKLGRGPLSRTRGVLIGSNEGEQGQHQVSL